MVSLTILSLDPPDRLLESIRKQTYQDFEILIANEKGIVTAMNSALHRAKGDIFVRIDDDVDLPDFWLEELVKCFDDPYVVGATGPTYVPIERRKNRDSIRIAENPNWFLRWLFDGVPFAPAKIYKCGSVSYGSNYFTKLDRSRLDVDHLEGTNWAMRTKYIRDVGGFDPKFGGVAEWYDTDVEKKILKKYPFFKLRYNTQAFVWHLLERGEHFGQRHEMWGRIKNWIRFHARHSKPHPKMLVWLLMMIGYGACQRFR